MECPTKVNSCKLFGNFFHHALEYVRVMVDWLPVTAPLMVQQQQPDAARADMHSIVQLKSILIIKVWKCVKCEYMVWGHVYLWSATECVIMCEKKYGCRWLQMHTAYVFFHWYVQVWSYLAHRWNSSAKWVHIQKCLKLFNLFLCLFETFCILLQPFALNDASCS